MIEMCSADRAPDPAVLRSPGGFTWFYADIVDDRGWGATVIWSWGLPFLPGYAQASRAGRPQLPIERPSVNIAVYSPRGEEFYLLTELPSDRCAWGIDGRSWTLGGCDFSWVDTPGVAGSAPTRRLQASLDLGLPTGGRVTGRLWVSGAVRRGAAAAPDDRSTHGWTPMIAAGRGGLELSTPSGGLCVLGRAYHDRNAATRPLHELGIQNWWWGRIALAGRDLIFYRLAPSLPGAPPRVLIVEVAEDGGSRLRENAGLEVGRLRRSPWGLRWPSTLTFPDPDGRPVRVEIDTVVDNGPFYQRFLLRGRCGAEEGFGIGENLVPDRVDAGLLRPLVRMRVHRAAGPNSMWLPLFSGDSDGRWGRLLGRSRPIRA